MPPPINIEDWRQLARRKLPDVALNYVEGGSDDLVTLNENMTAFRKWRLRQRTLTGISNPDLTTTIAGTELSMPLACAPIGSSGLCHYSGDIAVARAAEVAGTRLCLSGAGSYKIEEVAAATDENHWFQLYALGPPGRAAELIARAKAAGYTALFVTDDMPTIGNRESERRWQKRLPWTITPSRALDLIRHWRWLSEALVYKRIAAVHFMETDVREIPSLEMMSGMADAMASAENLERQIMLADLNWDDIRWFRDLWPGPMYIKGILDPEDAAMAVYEIGAQGVVVSNHGRRQMDRCLASVDALAAIVDRIGARAEVYLDGGVRRGTDVVTALALGAKGVFVGRPYLYGLAAKGEEGVRSVLEIFRDEIKRTLILMGCPSVSALNRSWLIHSPVS